MRHQLRTSGASPQQFLGPRFAGSSRAAVQLATAGANQPTARDEAQRALQERLGEECGFAQ